MIDFPENITVYSCILTCYERAATQAHAAPLLARIFSHMACKSLLFRMSAPWPYQLDTNPVSPEVE